MKVIIDIPTKEFGIDIADRFQDFFKRLHAETKANLLSNHNLVCSAYELETIEMFLKAFKKMKIVPDNATNGDVIKAMFPNVEIYTAVINEIVDVEICEDNSELRCSVDWWNAPYKKEVEE